MILALLAAPRPRARTRRLDLRRPTPLEAKHLTNIRQVTSGFAKAGEGYFRPDGKADHLPGRRCPAEDDYQIYTQDLAPGSKPKLVSTGKGKCTCSYYHPDGKSILFASTHLDPGPELARRQAEGPRLQPVRALSLGLRPARWTSSRPTSTARTSSA